MNRLLFPLLLLLQFAAIAQHKYGIKKGDILFEVGTLPPFNFNSKVGVGLNDGFLMGLAFETQEIFVRRDELGVFARKKITGNRLALYLQGGIAYSKFEDRWNFGDRDHRRRRQPNYESLKLNTGIGSSFAITNNFSLGHEVSLGMTTSKRYWYPGFFFTASYRLAQK